MAATACPYCGYPVAAESGKTQRTNGRDAEQNSGQVARPSTRDTLLAEVWPSWWRFFWHLFFFWLIVPPIIAWARRRSVVLRIYPGRVTLERGLLSKSYRELMVSDIRSIEIDQGILARIIGIGDLTISTAAAVDPDEEIEGIPNPKAVRDLIAAQRQAG
jgi:membrane protein YdbS with pleckstrin-like domain